MHKIAISVLVLAAISLMPVAATAQAIGGSITDTTGGVLPGVTIEVRSPALIEQVRSAISDGAGQYLVVGLVPGTYSVTFTLAGFSTLVREGIELVGAATANVNAQLQVGTVEETITVSGVSPVVDVQNTAQQAVMNREVIDSVPNGRQFSNLAVLVPGMTSGTIRAAVGQDVGGQSGQIHMELGIHGGDPSDQDLVVDGMAMGSWLQESGSTVWFTDGNFQEYQIDHSANGADIETGGVRINMIPREGGNTFSSRTFVTFTGQGLQRDNLSDQLMEQGLLDANRVKELWQVNPSIGGPIVRDKLWFFGSFTRSVADAFVADTYHNVDDTSNVYVPDLSRQAVDDQNVTDVGVRLTWQATSRNKVNGYFDYNRVCHCHFLIGSASIGIPVAPTASVFYDTKNYTTQVNWVSPVTSRMLVDAGFGVLKFGTDWQNQPEVGGSGGPNPRIGILEVGSGLVAYGNMSAWYNRSSSLVEPVTYTARASLSYVTGSHAAKFGFTAIIGNQKTTRANNAAGDYVVRTRFGSPLQVQFNGNPVVTETYVRPNLGIYAQDQWTLDRLTINAGVRFDIFRSGYPDHNNPPTNLVPVARVFEGNVATDWKDVQPRLGVVYDLFGDGRTALKATANRYGDREGMGFADALNPSANNNVSGYRFWRDFNQNFIPDCNPLNPAPNGECLTPGNQDFGKAVVNTFYDPNWSTGWGNRYSNWEFSGSIQQELASGVSVNVAYFRRIFTNFNLNHNRAVSPDDYDPYCVTVPLDARLPGGGGNQICDLYDIKPEKAGIVDVIRTSTDQFGKQTRHWNGVDLTVNARMSNGLLLQGGWSAGRTTTDDCEVAAAQGNPSQLYCETKTPFISDVKALGAYTLPGDVQISATFQAIQGPPVRAEVSYSPAEIAASLGRLPSESGSTDVHVIAPGAEYGPRLYQTDFRVTKIFNWGPSRVQAMFDLYNAFNTNTVLTINDQYGADGSDWLIPGAIVPGLLAKFGFQVDF